MCPSINLDFLDYSIPSVVVVDPAFDGYASLAKSCREGRLDLHMRSSGAEALKLARRRKVDAWLIAPELDDMSGHDLVPLLQAACAKRSNETKIAMVSDVEGVGRRLAAACDAVEAGADSLLGQPITLADLERLLELPAEERARFVTPEARPRPFIALPVGVGAAVVAIAVLMMG